MSFIFLLLILFALSGNFYKELAIDGMNSQKIQILLRWQQRLQNLNYWIHWIVTLSLLINLEIISCSIKFTILYFLQFIYVLIFKVFFVNFLEDTYI